MASLLPESVLPFSGLQNEVDERLAKADVQLNEYGFDPYGFEPASMRRYVLPSAWLYRNYFRVDTHDIENAPRGRMMLIANHSGQFAWDAMMLTMSMLLDASPPRIARGMGEYFLFSLPWIAPTGARAGMMVGTPDNCVHMLQNDQCVMVFPEGASGANKPYRKRYQLQDFGQGFMRLALEADAPIVPVGIVGAEEQQPGFANFERFGRSIGLPSLPITISMPWLGLLGPPVALPVKYRIYFGEPLHFEGSANDEDAAIDAKVDVVKAKIRGLLARGLRERESIFW